MPRISKPTDGASDQPKPRRAAAKAPNGAANGGNGRVSEDQVSRRAYEIYESRGAQHGSDLDHWLQAERELTSGPTSVTGSLRPAKPKKAKKTPEAGV
jgi:hypothetical protein